MCLNEVRLTFKSFWRTEKIQNSILHDSSFFENTARAIIFAENANDLFLCFQRHLWIHPQNSSSSSSSSCCFSSSLSQCPFTDATTAPNEQGEFPKNLKVLLRPLKVEIISLLSYISARLKTFNVMDEIQPCEYDTKIQNCFQNFFRNNPVET